MSKNKTPLPQHFTSIEEIQEFWETHSSADYWDEMNDVEMSLSPGLQSQIELKKLYRLLGLSSQQIATIEAKAAQKHMASRQLLSQWVLEHVSA